MSEIDMAWAAGLFEGEGSVGLRTGKTGRVYIRVTLGTTDVDVLEKFRAVIGGGRIYKGAKPAMDHHKQVYVLHLVSNDARILLRNEDFTNHLGIRRRKKIDECLSTVDSQRPRRFRGWDITHCPHGHLYDESNTYRGPDGNRRVCRTCARKNGSSRPSTIKRSM